MRREQFIYIQSGVCVRNRDQINVNTSSDWCYFDATQFGVSGATKVIKDEKTCNFSGLSYTDMLSAATVCFLNENLSGDCYNGSVWTTNVVADGITVNQDNFYTSSDLTTDAPTEDIFLSSVRRSLNTLAYDYSESGATFTIQKPYGVTELRFDICIAMDIDPNCLVTGTTCGCPVGYTANTSGDACVFKTSTGATLNGSLITVTTGDTNPNYCTGGALFYSDISNEPLPISDITNTSINIQNASGDTLVFQQQVKNNLWGLGTIPTGRLNNIGVWGVGIPDDEWVGFSKCVEVPETKIYSIGIAADDRMRFRINGEEIFNFIINGNGYSHQYWRVLEIELKAGTNIIEMEGLNEGSDASFGAEIYDSTIDVLSGYTSEAQLSAVTIFSTGDLIGGYFDLGTSSGYTCPTGYALDTCVTGTPVCTLIEYLIPDPCAWTGNCDTVCYTACTDTFNTLTSGSTGVYIVTGETQEINFEFNLSGDTSSLTSDTVFKYEVYKYNPNIRQFDPNPVYSSVDNLYSDITGTTGNILVDSIPVSSLSLDGDYLIKGYFEYNACTDFADKLGFISDTSFFKGGKEYGLYNEEQDWYFVAINDADVPNFNLGVGAPQTLSRLTTYPLFNEFSGQTTYTINEEYLGDVSVALNGSMLAREYDYVVTGNTLILTAQTFSGDVITIIQADGDDNVNLKVDAYNITTPIVSGTTNGQGSNIIYYNTDYNKYEVYTSINPTSPDVVVSVNGSTLINGIDYYPSISDPRRIILEVNINVGDVITLTYVPTTEVNGILVEPTYNVNFSIENPPQLANGRFILELTTANDPTFSAVTYTSETPYIPGENSYSLAFSISGASYGDQFLYRVKNQKEYVSLNGDIIIDVQYSEIVDIEVQTNNLNSY